MNGNQIGLARFSIGSDWLITHHTLSEIDPEDLQYWEVPDLLKLWPLYFVQDLLLLEKKDGSELIDVGWLPEAEMEGGYLIERITKGADGKWNWKEPKRSERTRSLQQIIELVRQMTTENRNSL